MDDSITIRDVAFVSAPESIQRSGLMGWVSFSLNGSLRVDGVTLRKAADGRHLVSFPKRIDAGGGTHFILRPLHDQARKSIESQILRALGLKGSQAP